MRWFRLAVYRKISEVLVVPGSECPLLLQNVVRPLELSDSYRGANVGHAVVVADLIVPVLFRRRHGLGLEMVSLLENVSVVADHHAAFTGRNRLVSKKTESGHVAECPDMPTAIKRPEGFGAVLDQQNSMLGADLGNCIHVTGSAVKVHDHHGFRARRKRPSYS